VNMIGVLDLQGDVVEHLDHLDRLGITAVRVKEPADFTHLAGLIIPGGESTCLSRLLNIFGIREVILQEFQRGLKLWGTCAGTILIADKVIGESPCLGLIDIEVQKNAFGSQLDSFTSEVTVPRVAPGPIPLTFHRYFALKCDLKPSMDEESSIIDPTWDNRSWTRYTRL